MPLPEINTPWPPPELASITPRLREWSAWYEGTPEALRTAYGRGNFHTPGTGFQLAEQRASQRGGFMGIISRLWWGRPAPANGVLPRDMIHVPIAADLCQASADLLFADAPTFTVADKTTQVRLDQLADDGLLSTLAEAAEVGAALGGSYLRVTWDREMRPDAPFLTSVAYDAAIPEFRWGMLSAVTFWTQVKIANTVVWRHLERHELDVRGFGVTQHALYEGTVENIGRPVPLTETPATAAFSESNGLIQTLTPGLAVVHIPNQRPQRRWRNLPAGAGLGRSDLDGVESLMDALDETYASWMRDIRLGKGRILMAQSMLENLGAGQGQFFDAEQEAYTGLNMLASGGAGNGASGLPIQEVQFKIRYAEHKATAEELVLAILRTAGYSSQTFGEGGDPGGRATATEVENRERRSMLTRDRKIRHWRPGVADALEKLLAVDAVIFGSGVSAERPAVTFTDGVQESQLVLAQTALALYQAESASIEVRVAMLHPDWDDAAVAEEAAKIKAEQPATTLPALGDPFGQPPGQTGPDNPPTGP